MCTVCHKIVILFCPFFVWNHNRMCKIYVNSLCSCRYFGFTHSFVCFYFTDIKSWRWECQSCFWRCMIQVTLDWDPPLVTSSGRECASQFTNFFIYFIFSWACISSLPQLHGYDWKDVSGVKSLAWLFIHFTPPLHNFFLFVLITSKALIGSGVFRVHLNLAGS